MDNNKQPYRYKRTNNQSIIKKQHMNHLQKGLKPQINPKKLAVQKTNPTK